MTVRSSYNGVVLEGHCPSEDAEALLQALLDEPDAAVDLRFCDFAHAAVLQVLMTAKRRVIGPPAGEFWAIWVHPLLDST